MSRDTFSEIIRLAGGGRDHVEINEYPDFCVWCNQGMTPDYITGHSLGRAWDYDEVIEAVFQCSQNKCKRYFIAYYGKVDRMGKIFFLRAKRAPHYWKPEEFPEIVNEISENFVVIYNQAKIAEDWGLDQICGAGYGRALEFLIKDYLIKENPKQKKKISDLRLYKCIEMIKDAKVQSCAKRGWWLRHDETHYQKIWKDKDVSHLKELIRLVVNWIESSEITKKYEKDMPERKSG